jgi:hypothetical protein
LNGNGKLEEVSKGQSTLVEVRNARKLKILLWQPHLGRENREQRYHDLDISLTDTKGLLKRPTCIGTERARILLLFYFIPFYSVLFNSVIF